MKTKFRKFLDSRSLNSVKISGNEDSVYLRWNISGVQSGLSYFSNDKPSVYAQEIETISILREALGKYEAHVKWLAAQPKEDVA